MSWHGKRVWRSLGIMIGKVSCTTTIMISIGENKVVNKSCDVFDEWIACPCSFNSCDCLCSRDGNVLKGSDVFNILLSPVLEVNRSSHLYLLLRELKSRLLTPVLRI